MVERVSQWLSLRQVISDWRTGKQNFNKNLVLLEDQEVGLSSHPLPMEALEDCIGWQLFGAHLQATGALPIVNYNEARTPVPVPFIPQVETWMQEYA